MPELATLPLPQFSHVKTRMIISSAAGTS